MAAPFPSQIERRPMTSKQARKRWQANGCPTISPAERRRLQREAELERRAQKIRDDEKRKKDNARKRKEKEQHDKDVKQRMGFQEEIKLPEGQLGLGQFFTKRITRAAAKAEMVQQEALSSPIGRTNVQLEQDVSENNRNLTHEDEQRSEENVLRHDDDIARGCTSSSVQILAQRRSRNSQPSPAATPPQKQKLWFSTPKKLKEVTMEENVPNKPYTADQRLASCKPLADLSTPINIGRTTSPLYRLSQELAYRPISAPSSQDTKCEQEAGQAVLAQSALTIMPEARISTASSTSLPSVPLKRDLEQAYFNRVDSLDNEGVPTSKMSPRKRPRTACLDSTSTESTCLGCSVAVLQDFLAATPYPAAFDQSFVKHQYKISSGTTNTKSAEVCSQISVQVPAESFTGSLLDEDFDAIDDARTPQSTPRAEHDQALSQTKRPIPSLSRSSNKSKNDLDAWKIDDHAGSAIDSKKVSENRNSSARKKPFGRTQSAQSYACDFSSQDYAELEEMINIPRQVDKTTPVLPIPKIELLASPTKSTHLSCNSSFDLSGCTQALAALVDTDEMDAQESSPIAIRETKPHTKTRATMLPPPPRPLRPLPSHTTNRHHPTQFDDPDDIYNCFAGSTQALLDL